MFVLAERLSPPIYLLLSNLRAEVGVGVRVDHRHERAFPFRGSLDLGFHPLVDGDEQFHLLAVHVRGCGSW